jgi:IS5 family transposase
LTHRDRSEYKTRSSVKAVCKSVTIPGMTGHVRRNTHKVRYRGMEKNQAQLFSLFALANLVLAKRCYAVTDGVIAS